MDNTLLQNAVEKVIGKSTQVYGFHHTGGGEINQTYKVITDKGVFFVKVHDLVRYPKLFEKEVSGLKTILETHAIEVTNPIGICDCDGKEFLFLEYIEEAPMSKTYWSDLGEHLAKLHMNTNRNFGFQEDNFIGSLVQLNNRVATWGQFFIKNRLMPNIRKASENMFLNAEILHKFDKYFLIVEFAFPDEPPSLVHGNLWKEHILVSAAGSPVLSNPSIYYGHREMDIAMTKMVGSFDPSFYAGYQSIFPLQADWEIRLDFCQMYYALVNLNTYGSPYLPLIEDKLNRWVK